VTATVLSLRGPPGEQAMVQTISSDSGARVNHPRLPDKKDRMACPFFGPNEQMVGNAEKILERIKNRLYNQSQLFCS
jgi:hypothetical protein